jgi:hypothetical protein
VDDKPKKKKKKKTKSTRVVEEPPPPVAPSPRPIEVAPEPVVVQRPAAPVRKKQRIATDPAELHFAYLDWLRANPYPTPFDAAHTCTSKCDFRSEYANTMAPMYICVKNGDIHMCGSTCTRSVRVDHQCVCELTGETIASDLQYATDTISQLVVNVRHFSHAVRT